jgi:signal transduction histidine kinase
VSVPAQSAPDGGADPADEASDWRTLWVTTGAVASMFALGAVAQSTYIFAAFVPGWQYVSVVSRVIVNALSVLVLIAVLALWRQQHRITRLGKLLGAVLAGLIAALARVVLQVLLGVYPAFGPKTVVAEAVTGAAIGVGSAVLGTWVMMSRRRLRAEVRERVRTAHAVETAVQALEDEEIRVRREVADGLHSSMQQRLVLVTARLDGALARLAAAGTPARDLATLREVRTEIENVREQDVRQMSRLLYPDQLEIGMVPAVRALLRRVPPAIATHLEVDEELRALDDPAAPELSQAERLLAVRVVEEAVSNALRHGTPTEVDVRLGVNRTGIALRVRDDGGGFDPAAVTRSGTKRLAERLSIVGGRLDVKGVLGVGTEVVATLPVDALRGR